MKATTKKLQSKSITARVSDDLISQIIERIPGLVAVYNIRTGQYIFTNDSVKKILGYTKEDFLEKGVAFVGSLVHPEDVPLIMAKNQEALKVANSKMTSKNDSIVNFEYRMRHKNGSWRWFHTDGVVFDRNEKGLVEHVMNISIDITERKETEIKANLAKQKGEEANYKLAAIVDSSDDAIVSKTLDGIITSWNKGAEKLFGYREKEVIGKPITTIIPENLYDEERAVIQKLRKGIRISHFETIRLKKDGTLFPVSLSISPIKNGFGQIIGASKIARDITQQKRTEAALIRGEERLRLAIEAGDIGVWDWEIDSNVLAWTKKVYEMHGITNFKQVVTVDFFINLIHPEDKAFVQEAINKSIQNRIPYNIKLRIITPAKVIRYLTTSAVGIYDGRGKCLRMIGATSDITNQTRLEQDRSDFISIATHELKTPVTSIKAYAEVLQRKFLKSGDSTSADQLGKMNAQLDKLTSLISDLLDATKIESGKLQMHQEKFSFDELVTEIVEELQRTTEKHKIIIKGRTDKKIQADRERTGQVLTNLISNAIKYSPHTDKILVNLSAKIDRVQVCVQDFGIGIPKDKQSKLFERFYRVSGPSDNTFPGLGLGLYISSEIIKRQGGKIWVESTIGKGSNFYFALPVKINLK